MTKLGTEKTGFNSSKLIADLNDKINYSVHWKYLHDGLMAGLKIRKVHKIIKFRQLDFCKTYIQKCIQARSNAKTLFEKNMYKLAQNSL